jgi:hypothetical protein
VKIYVFTVSMISLEIMSPRSVLVVYKFAT